MQFAVTTPFVLLIASIADNHWGSGKWRSTVLGFMLACSLVGTAWVTLGRQAGDTSRDVVVSAGSGVQSGLTNGASGGSTETTTGGGGPSVTAAPPTTR